MSRGSEAARRLSSTVESSNSSSDWNERPMPEPRAPRRRQLADVLAVEHQLRARGHFGEAGDRVDQRGLAGAVRADQPEHLARADGQRRVVDGGRAAVFDASGSAPRASSAVTFVRSPLGAGSSRFGFAFGARNGISLPSFERRKASWAICSLTTPFWFSSTRTISETPPISGMYLPIPLSIEFSSRSEKAPGAQGGADHRAEQVADAADHRVGDHRDRGERGEFGVVDRGRAEGEQDAAERRRSPRPPRRRRASPRGR